MHASAARELLNKRIVSDQMWNCLVLSFDLPNVLHHRRIWSAAEYASECMRLLALESLLDIFLCLAGT